MGLIARSDEGPPSLFSGIALGPDLERFRRSGRPADRWIAAARVFVAVLLEWGELDEWTIGSPERVAWMAFDGYGLTFDEFREETASLAASIVIDPDIRALGHEPLTALVNLIEAAYLSAEDGGLFDLAELRRALGEAELTCRTIRFAADRREERKRALPAPVPDEPPQSPPGLVTLAQAAGMVHLTKRALEYYKTKGTLPEPIVEGGGGQSAFYEWKTLRPWLESTFHQPLPERFPASPKS